MTPAIRTDEVAQIEFSLRRYEHDPKADPFGLEATEKLGVLSERVYKALVVQVDAKQLTLIDTSAFDQLMILVSTEQRGLQMELSPVTASRPRRNLCTTVRVAKVAARSRVRPRRLRQHPQRNPAACQARMSLMTLPYTSVRRKSRPLKR